MRPSPEMNYSAASERNKAPILEVLKLELADFAEVCEIGSGTGQHAVYFSEKLPHLVWQPCDLLENHPDIQARVDQAQLSNLKSPLVLDVNEFPWPVTSVDAMYSANTLHIISQESVQSFFKGIKHVLKPGGKLCVYGPFNYGGNFTTESNAEFDQQLKRRDPVSGIRDFEWVNQLAEEAGCSLLKDYEMPANNRLLVWEKK